MRSRKTENNLTLGSLFDGSGGFPLAGLFAGIQPVWASEVEPFPIRVTTKRLPGMKHYGDITRMNGGQIEPVDIVTFGSPCQDMSIAGKRAGLKASRSGLFYEAVRVVKEMREATNGQYPKYIVWENVTGAYSSNGGEDFRAVLEAVCSVKGEFSVPRPAKWTGAGEILADGFSVAWRTLDAQYWGVPQRRKRVFLVADLAGGRAGKVLFESEGLSGYPPARFSEGQRAAGTAEESIGASGGEGLNNSAVFENHAQDARYTGPLETSPAVSALCGTGGNNQPFVVEKARTYDVRFTSEGTRNARSNVYETDTARTIDTGIPSPERNQGGVAVVERRPMTVGMSRACGDARVAPTLDANSGSPTCNQGGAVVVESVPAESVCTVRRITPLECARLQGFPDDWCDGLETENPTEQEMSFWREVFETHRLTVTKASRPRTDAQIRAWLKSPRADSAEYRMWGNGIALPCAAFVLAGIVWADGENIS